MTNPPRKHHYLPVFYQKQWVGNDSQVERYLSIEGRGLNRKRVFPSASGYAADLYADPRFPPDQWPAQRLEAEVFGAIDDRAAKSLQIMLDAGVEVLSQLERHDWVRFVRSMFHRTPTHMAATLAKCEEIWRSPDKAVQEKYNRMRRPGYPDTVEEFLETLNPNAARDAAFRSFGQAMERDRLANYMVSLRWRVLECSSSDFSFLLSDNPVVIVPLLLANGQLAMPLSPTRIWIASKHETILDGICRMTPNALARQANLLAVERAYHCVISSDRQQEAFIMRRFGSNRIGSLASGFEQR